MSFLCYDIMVSGKRKHNPRETGRFFWKLHIRNIRKLHSKTERKSYYTLYDAVPSIRTATCTANVTLEISKIVCQDYIAITYSISGFRNKFWQQWHHKHCCSSLNHVKIQFSHSLLWVFRICSLIRFLPFWWCVPAWDLYL